MNNVEDIQAVATGFVGQNLSVLILSQEWRDAVKQSSASLAIVMHRLGPAALEVQSLWESRYGRNLVIDIATSEVVALMPHDINWLLAREKKLASDMRFVKLHLFFTFWQTMHFNALREKILLIN